MLALKFLLLCVPLCIHQATAIRGGTHAEVGQFPSQGRLQTYNGQFLCGATIVSESWALTTSYCLYGLIELPLLVVGAVLTESGGFSYNLDRIVRHPFFNYNTFANDLTLAHTASTIFFTPSIQPASLGNKFLRGGTTVVATGYGEVHPPRLNYAEFSIITNDDCKYRYSPVRQYITPNTLCTLNRASTAVCTDDKGSGLLVGNDLIGVASWSVGCAYSSPDVHVRIADHRYWIISIITS